MKGFQEYQVGKPNLYSRMIYNFECSPWEMYLTKTIYSPQQYWVKVKGQQQLRAEETYRFNGQKANIKNGNFLGS